MSRSESLISLMALPILFLELVCVVGDSWSVVVLEKALAYVSGLSGRLGDGVF